MEIHVNVPFVGYKRTAADEKQRDKMREWERDLKYACQLEMITQGYPLFTSNVGIVIEANFPPGKSSYDIDRISSWVLDSIKQEIVQDDSQVKELYIRLTETPIPEHTIIKIMPF